MQANKPKKASRVKWYICGLVAALGIGAAAGAKYAREIGHAYDVVEHNMTRGIEKLEEFAENHPNMPGYETFRSLGEQRARQLVGDPETYREQRRSALQQRLEEYNRTR